jgi:hypothetical protein
VRIAARLVTKPFSLNADRTVMPQRSQKAALEEAALTDIPVEESLCTLAIGLLRTSIAVKGKPSKAIPPNKI